MGVEVNLKTEVLILISSLGGSWGVKHAGCPPINPISWMSSAKLSPCAPPPSPHPVPVSSRGRPPSLSGLRVDEMFPYS